MGGFGANWGAPGQSDLRVGCVWVGENSGFFGFEGPATDMDTQKVVLTVHVAKVHVLYWKSNVFGHSRGQGVHFRMGFGTNGMPRSKVTSVYVAFWWGKTKSFWI